MTKSTVPSVAPAVLPCGRAQAMSALRVVLHVAVAVGLAGYFAGLDNTTALIFGLVLGLAVATRSRRVGVELTEQGVVIRNFFRTFVVTSLDGATVHLYMRNRTELEAPGHKQFFVQAATLFSEADHEVFLQGLEARGAAVVAGAANR